MVSNAEFYTSTISDAEFLVKPYANSDFETADKYYEFLKDFDFIKCYITNSIAQNSAKLRAKHKSLRLADSLQLAAAIDCGCNIFVTNDVRLKSITEISVYILG